MKPGNLDVLNALVPIPTGYWKDVIWKMRENHKKL